MFFFHGTNFSNLVLKNYTWSPLNSKGHKKIKIKIKIYRSKILNKINKSKKISLVTKITNSKIKKIKLYLQILSKINNLTF